MEIAMRPILFATVALALAAAGHAARLPTATAALVDASGASKGSATFAQTPGGVRVRATITGMEAGEKGIHLHTVGKCEGPDFASAGAHWNPTQHQHGTKNPAGAHMGDMKNVVLRADGGGSYSATIPNARLKDGFNPLLDADGAAIVVHAAADDYKTDPSGNSGGRVACGVITSAG